MAARLHGVASDQVSIDTWNAFFVWSHPALLGAKPGDWGGPYWSDEMASGIEERLQDADTILIGTDTYVRFTELWQSKGDSSPMVAFLTTPTSTSSPRR